MVKKIISEFNRSKLLSQFALFSGLKRGFTLVEVIVSISIIGILATIVVISYSGWQTTIVKTELKNDLTAAATAMENYRIFNNGYPTSVPSTFTPSPQIIVSGGSIDGGLTFCLDAISSKNSSVHFYSDSSHSVKPGSCGLASPINLVATTLSNNTINLTWGVVTNAINYELQRDINSAFTNAITIATPTGNSASSSGLTQATTYYYRIDVITASGTSVWSSTASATTIAINTPTLTATAPSTTSINLSWTTITNATNYVLQRDTNASFTTAVQIASQTGTTFTSSGLTQGNAYYYRVNDVQPDGTSGWSNTASAITTITAPSAPTVVASTVGPTTTYTWSSTCPAGTTARYEYTYYTSAGYNSGWIANTTGSFAATTSTVGYTYSLFAHTQCYTAFATSVGWGASSSAVAYYRSMVAQAAPAMTVALNGANVLATISPAVTCASGTIQYGIRSRTNDGTWGLYSDWSSTTTASQAASDGVKYGYQAQDRCYIDATNAPSATVIGAESTYIDPIATPAAPVVSASTVGPTTTYTWSSTCPVGTTARYEYTYYTSAGYNSGWIANATGSFAATTSSGGYTYSLIAHTQCYTAFTTSIGWSASSSAVAYYRPIALTAIAISGTTTIGSVLTAVATPSGATVTYEWQYSHNSNGGGYTGIPGATTSTYTLSLHDVGTYFRVIATATGSYAGIQTSTPSAIVSDPNWLRIVGSNGSTGHYVWAKANLNVGTMVTGATAQTNNGILEKYCYNNTESNCTTYGGLYQWNEAMQYVTTSDAQGICPAGSHVPDENEWRFLIEMEVIITYPQTAGIQLKPGGTSGLNIPLAGHRDINGSFVDLSSYARLWASLESSPSTNAWLLYLYSGSDAANEGTADKGLGYSVRCIVN